jgi:hypothetical protein
MGVFFIGTDKEELEKDNFDELEENKNEEFIDIYEEMEKIMKKYNQSYNKLDQKDVKMEIKYDKNKTKPIPIPIPREK